MIKMIKSTRTETVNLKLAPSIAIANLRRHPCAHACRILQLWYMLSKTLAEEAAWKFAKENGIDMVTMNPGWVIGPFLQPTVNATVKPILKFVNGAERTLDIPAVWVDVRDIANAHILAYENPSANGRYCLVASTISCSWVMKILRELYPTLNLPENKNDKPLELICKVSKEKAESLGLNFIPVEVTLKDTVESLREKNFFSVLFVVSRQLKSHTNNYKYALPAFNFNRSNIIRSSVGCF